MADDPEDIGLPYPGMILIDPGTGEPYAAGGGGGSSGPIEATVVEGGRNTLDAGVAEDVVAAGANAVGIEIRNAGAEDVTYVVDGTATGGANERVLLPGETRVFPYVTELNISMYSAAGTVVEWETWR